MFKKPTRYFSKRAVMKLFKKMVYNKQVFIKYKKEMQGKESIQSQNLMTLNKLTILNKVNKLLTTH